MFFNYMTYSIGKSRISPSNKKKAKNASSNRRWSIYSGENYTELLTYIS